MVYIFGWTVDQFAIAKARHARLTGESIEPTKKNAYALRSWWESKGYTAPNSVPIEGAEQEADYEFATNLLYVCDGYVPYTCN